MKRTLLQRHTEEAQSRFSAAAARKVYVQKFDISGGASQTYTPRAVRGPVSDAIQRRPPDLQITTSALPAVAPVAFGQRFRSGPVP